MWPPIRSLVVVLEPPTEVAINDASKMLEKWCWGGGVGSPNGPKMVEKWSENGPRVVRHREKYDLNNNNGIQVV